MNWGIRVIYFIILLFAIFTKNKYITYIIKKNERKKRERQRNKGKEKTLYRWYIIEFYSWTLYNFINQSDPSLILKIRNA